MLDAGKKAKRDSDHWDSLPLACLSSGSLSGQWAERSRDCGVRVWGTQPGSSDGTWDLGFFFEGKKVA